MALPYTPPGASVRENSSPSVSPLIASAANIALVGLAGNPNLTQTPIQTTDTVILHGTNPVALPTLANINNDAILVAVQAVTNVLDPSVGTPPGTGYVATTDYTVQTGESGPNGTNGTITRKADGGIPDGTLVAITYTYLPSDYWDPIRLYDISSVETRFGASWATATSPVTGQTYYTGVNSQLSMAARIAFANGAPSVICQPLFVAPNGSGTSPQNAPVSTDVGNAASWQNTLYNLRAIQDLDVIVPIVGQDGANVTDSDMLNIFGSVQAHLAYMNSEQQYMFAVFGEDGSASSSEFQNLILGGTSGSTSVLQQHAAYLQSSYGNALSSQCVLLNNVLFQLPTPSGSNTMISVGGQYAAAAVAGMMAAVPASQGLTRATVGGFKSVTDPRVVSQKNSDAAAGLMVLDQVGQVIRVRQSNTLDISNGPARAELSVVRAKFVMMESIQQTLDNQVIGKIIADANSPLVVRSAISSVLGILQQSRIIVGYSQVTAALTSTNPTVVTASFSYAPAFPLNFVNVSFSIDLTNNVVSVSDGTGNTTAGTTVA